MANKTNISLIHPHEATEEVQRLYDRIKSLMGRIAPTWRALAHKPEYLNPNPAINADFHNKKVEKPR